MKYIGKVSMDESVEINNIHNRKLSLAELQMIVTDASDPLYEKLLKDVQTTNEQFSHWWTEMSRKYHWENYKGKRFKINFNSGEVYIDN